MDEDARNIIQKPGRLYKERLLSAALESGFDLKAIPVVMLGGGASVVKGNAVSYTHLDVYKRQTVGLERCWCG